MFYFAMMDWMFHVNILLWAQGGGGDGACSEESSLRIQRMLRLVGSSLLIFFFGRPPLFGFKLVVMELLVYVQRPKNLGGRVALPPGKFLRVQKVFARNP